ncbi:acyltransferase [Clostridium saudiense]|uniref:Acyltransferase n=1 Tax=Clostridium saudiense TaxID=1414720 RepID=A0ABS2FIK8_9CLOT|nr:acyltransferase [Clostridium saudiense]MBM6820171.1 acyltransferase [Clostridium saudiense]
MRNKTIQIAKGIGIFLVVLTHAMIPSIRNENQIIYYIHKIVYMFHMPLFVMLSGYLYELNINKYKSIGKIEFIKAKFRFLMIPYLIFSVISYIGISICFYIPKLSQLLTYNGYESRDLFEAVIEILTTNNHIDAHLWFAYCLFGIFFISIILSDKLKSKIGLLILFILFIIRFIEYPLIIRKISYYLFYFTLGRVIIKRFLLDIKQKWKVLIYIGLFSVFSVVTILFESSDFILKLWIVRICTLVVAFSGAYIVIVFSNYLANFKIMDCFDNMGKYSFQIYLIHQPFIVSGIVGILHKFTDISIVILILVGTVCGIVIPIFITKVIELSNIRALKLTAGIK